MNDVALIFATESGRAIPRLKPMPGTAVPWDDDGMRELEAEVGRQYPDIARNKVNTITFRSRVLRVAVRNTDGRTPTLVLTDAEPPAVAPLEKDAARTPWLEGLLAEVSALAASADGSLPPLEKSMLLFVADELRQQAERVGPDQVAALLLAGHLVAAEGLFRPSDPERATVYAMAQRGLEKLLGRLGELETGRAVARPGKPAVGVPAGIFGRWMRRLFGVVPTGSGAP